LAEGFESSDQVYLDHLSRMSGLEKDSSANVFKDLIVNFRVAMYSDPEQADLIEQLINSKADLSVKIP